MSTTNTTPTIDLVVSQITTSNNIESLSYNFKTAINRDINESVLSSALANGQDPLSVLDLRTHTLGVLYILSARLHANFSQYPPPQWQIVQDFCANFIPEHARLAPDRVSKLAKGIQRAAALLGTPSSAIYPLLDLVTRYPPTPSHLTTIHSIFILTCVSTRNFLPTLPVLANPITEIDTTNVSPDLTYNDNLTYHYLGGVALAALKKWKEAEEYFEICVTSPGTYPSGLQMEALKKLRLVQLISCGKISGLPKYTNSHLLRLFKHTPYNAFISAYPKNAAVLREIVEKDKSLFSQEKNLGLITQALQRAPRWVLKKLTATYVTLHLSDIGRLIKIDSEDEVRALLLSMIESEDITAQISADGTVTFSDPPAQFTREQVDDVLRAVQEQTALLGYLELEVGRSKEFLSKVVKGGDSSASWAAAAEEDIFSGMGAQHVWDESSAY
ncbi:hypothetical protein CPC08DRAFT_224462 [Agrocybe pediades]|nr:hypothetical protein CPC08DRAFT_224462 [Agrocybe pediades]